MGGSRGQRGGYVGEPLANAANVGVRECAYELIAAEAHDQIVGAQAGSKGVGDGGEQGVSGEVTLGVVDLLESVDVDEGEDETLAAAVCSVYLSLQLLDPGTSSPDVCQLIDLRRFSIPCGLRAFVCGLGELALGLRAFLAGSGAIGSRSGAVGGCCGAIGRRPLTIVCLGRVSSSRLIRGLDIAPLFPGGGPISWWISTRRRVVCTLQKPTLV